MNAPMRGRLVDMSIGMNRKYRVTVELDIDYREAFDQLKGKELDIEIRRHRERRSRDANAFCWALCSEIGKALFPPMDKEDVYKRAIRAVGEYEPLPIKEEAVCTFQERWADKGTGWFADVIDDSKLPGYKLLFAYYGSQSRDGKGQRSQQQALHRGAGARRAEEACGGTPEAAERPARHDRQRSAAEGRSG